MARVFIKFDGVTSACREKKYDKYIECLSFVRGVNRHIELAPGAAGGITTGEVQVGDFSLVKYISNDSPKITEMLVKGDVAATAEMIAVRETGDKVEFEKTKFKQVRFTSISPNFSTGGSEPTENVTFLAEEWEIEYTGTDGAGKKAASTKVKWNALEREA